MMSGHSHKHTISNKGKNTFVIALIITLGFAAVEAFTGWTFGSLTLLGDAGHMVTDSISLTLAAIAFLIAQKPPSKTHTYGLGRAEIIAAWCSSLLMIGVIIGIVIEAIERLHHPLPVAAGPVILVAIVGLIINVVVAWILSKGEKSLNTRAAILHVLNDLMGSVAVLISGAIIYFTQWTLIDPILSLFICFLIGLSTYRLLRESLLILMEGVPQHIAINDVKKSILSLPDIKSVHDLHVWTLSSGLILLTAHVQIDDLKKWNVIKSKLCNMLLNDYNIEHATLQPETNPEKCKLFCENSP